MAWAVRLSEDARREFLKLPSTIQNHIAKRLRALEETPFPPGCKKLVGSNHYRIRVGAYRVIYCVHTDKQLVQVTRIRHRGEVYRRL